MRLIEDDDDDDLDAFGRLAKRWAASVDAHSTNQNPKPVETKPKPLKPQKFKSGRAADFYREVLRDGGNMFGADESELSFDEVKHWIATHRKLFAKGGLTVYRTMQLTSDEFAGVRPGNELGNHWTYEFDESNIEGFNINLRNKTKELYVFEATIRTGEVAFPLTVAYNVYFPHEKEIFLDSRYARPKIVTVRHFDTRTFMLDDENLRPDLVGVEMRA
jgi:hypothetical protein